MSGNDSVLAAIEALDACSIPCMLVGSYASNVYGVDHARTNIDFVIEPGEASIGGLARRLSPTIRLDRQKNGESGPITTRFAADVSDSPFQIAFFLLSPDPHDQEQFRRRLSVTILGREVLVPTPEDVIITKLRWSLLAHRPKDRDDARDVIAVQGDRIDWDYVHPWSEIHGTRALLDEVRRSIPPI